MNSWHFESFGSGTHIVKSVDANYPYCYVYADNRRDVCIDLENWLNHAKIPEWANTLKVSDHGEDYLVGDFGISITIIGPMVLPPNDDGRLNWQTCPSENSKKLRRQLRDRLLNIDGRYY